MTPWTVACQAPVSLGRILQLVAISFSRESCWPRNQTGVSSPSLQADSLPTELQRKPKSKSCSVVSHSLWSHGLYSPCTSPGQNTGVGSFSLHQEIFQPRNGIQVSLIAGRFFTCWATMTSLVYHKVRWRKRKLKSRWNFDHCVSVFSLVPRFFFFLKEN